MADVVVERTPIAGASDPYVAAVAAYDIGCLDLHRVYWNECLVDNAGRRLICHLRAPDAESVRMALGRTMPGADAIWAATIHDVSESTGVTWVVERELRSPLSADAGSELETLKAECLNRYGLKLVRVMISPDRLRILCLCEALETGSIHPAQAGGAPAGDRVWSCQQLTAVGYRAVASPGQPDHS